MSRESLQDELDVCICNIQVLDRKKQTRVILNMRRLNGVKAQQLENELKKRLK